MGAKTTPVTARSGTLGARTTITLTHSHKEVELPE